MIAYRYNQAINIEDLQCVEQNSPHTTFPSCLSSHNVTKTYMYKREVLRMTEYQNEGNRCAPIQRLYFPSLCPVNILAASHNLFCYHSNQGSNELCTASWDVYGDGRLPWPQAYDSLSRKKLIFR